MTTLAGHEVACLVYRCQQDYLDHLLATDPAHPHLPAVRERAAAARRTFTAIARAGYRRRHNATEHRDHGTEGGERR